MLKVFCQFEQPGFYNYMNYVGHFVKAMHWKKYTLPQKKRNFSKVPNAIFTMLLVPILQKHHSKIPHSSHTVIRHLSSSHRCNFTKLDASSKFESCLSFGEECMLEKKKLRILLATIFKRPHSKTPHHYLTILKCLSTSHLWKIIKLTTSSNSPRRGLRILVTVS